MVTASRILGDEVGSTAPTFLAVLAVHVLAGLTAVITGAIAALARKGSARHIRVGRWYYRAVTAVFATATAAPIITRAIIRAKNKARLSGSETSPAAGSSESRPGAARDARPGR